MVPYGVLGLFRWHDVPASPSDHTRSTRSGPIVGVFLPGRLATARSQPINRHRKDDYRHPQDHDDD